MPTLKYGKFEMPDKIKVDDTSKTTNFSKFIVEPFERGFGHTVGNSLRRVLLTSLEAPAIISIKMEGVSHEYTAIEGVIEDMTHIVLNLKASLIRKLPVGENSHPREVKVLSKVLEVTDDMLNESDGKYSVTLKDLMDEGEFEIMSPDRHLFTVTKPMLKRIDLRVGIGRGYVPSERHEVTDQVIDEIVVDSIFSPVRLVNYFVENTRVGQDTDFDRLILEIQTDGRVTPQEALTFASQIVIEHFHIFEKLKTHALSFDQGETEVDKDRDEIMSKLALKISEIELSVRSTNCLSSANIDTIGELVVMPESEMLRFRNFGKKSLTEIKEKLDDMGLHLGMDLNRYGINRDNIKPMIDKYLEDKIGNSEQ